MKNKVKSIIAYLNRQFPFANAKSWDKSGHQIGDYNLLTKTIVVALDLTTEVLDLAVANQAWLIVVHHPFFFAQTWEEDLAKAPYKQQIFNRLHDTSINVVVLHSNYDIAENGMVEQLRIALKLTKTIYHGTFGALIRANLNYEELEKRFHNLQINFIQSNVKQKYHIKNLALIPGAGSAENILEYQEADLIITSDIKWSTWVMAKEEKISLVEIPHYVEEVFVTHLSELLRKKYQKLNVISYFNN